MMEDGQTKRRLAAILAADVVGYSRLMADDEAGTLAALNRHRENEFNPAVARHRGRIVKLIGDGTLVEFTSVVDAVNCAVAIQHAVIASRDASPPIVLRIGINLGDVIIDDDDIYGDGVNVASRLEQLASPGGICISSIVNESVGSRSEVTFTDGGEVHVKNIDRPLRVLHWLPRHTSDPGATQSTAPERQAVKQTRENPAIAVLPFENMSGDAEQEYFSDGISEDIITDLSKVPGLLVIARNSSFAYKGKTVDVRKVGQVLGVSSILEGSVRRSGNRVRVTAQLIDAATGGHLWAERYDGDLTDIFEVQDNITLKIVDALKLHLTPAQKAGIAGAGTTDVAAHDCFLRARSIMVSPNLSAALYTRAVGFCERAIEIDSNYAQPHAILAILGVMNFLNRFVEDEPQKQLASAAVSAERSVVLGPDQPTSHQAVAIVARWMGDLDLAIEKIEQSLALNADQASSLFTRGEVLIAAGRSEESIADIERAIRLNPELSHLYMHYLGLAHLLLGHYETAALMFRERLLLAKDTDVGRAMLASTLGHLGEIEEARQTWKDLKTINPDFSIEQRLQRLMFADPSHVDRIVGGLTKAGLPD